MPFLSGLILLIATFVIGYICHCEGEKRRIQEEREKEKYEAKLREEREKNAELQRIAQIDSRNQIIMLALSCDKSEAESVRIILEKEFMIYEFLDAKTADDKKIIVKKAQQEHTKKEKNKQYINETLLPLANANGLRLSFRDIEWEIDSFFKKNDVDVLEKLRQIEYRVLHDNFRNTDVLINALKGIVEDPEDEFCVIKSCKYKLTSSEIGVIYDCIKEKFGITPLMGKYQFLQLEGLDDIDREKNVVGVIFTIMLMFSNETANVMEYVKSNLPQRHRGHYLVNGAIYFKLYDLFFDTIYYDIENAVEVVSSHKEELKKQIELEYEVNAGKLEEENQLEIEKATMENFYDSLTDMCNDGFFYEIDDEN